MKHDSRRFQRIDIEAPARIEIMESRKKRKIVESYVSNLSVSGAFFPALRSLRLGKKIKVDILLVFEGPHVFADGDEFVVISTSGTVTRSDLSGTAVSFENDYSMTSSQLYGDLLVTRDADFSPPPGNSLHLK